MRHFIILPGAKVNNKCMEFPESKIQSEQQLVADLRLLIENAKSRVVSVANAGITMLYWHIG